MPYHLVYSSNGKATVEDDKGRYYSNMPIAITRAKAQMKALQINVHHKKSHDDVTTRSKRS
jgi:hypothetical protein